MKAKVLKYKFDGNTIVAPYMELEPYAENAFFPADSIHAESLTRRGTGKKRRPIARTGLKTP